MPRCRIWWIHCVARRDHTRVVVTLRGPRVPVRLEFEPLLLFSFLAGVVSRLRALFRLVVVAACLDGFVDEFL